MPTALRHLVATFIFGLMAATVSVTGFAVTATPAAANEPFWVVADREAAARKKVATKTFAAKQKVAKSQSSKSKTYTAAKKPKTYASAKPSQNKVKVAAKRKKLGGYAERTEPGPKKRKGVKVAALGRTFLPPAESKAPVTGGGVRWVASAGCLDGGLKAIVYQVASTFGPVTVSSTCRGKSHNRKVGGAPKSKHLTGDAVDFRVHGKWGGVASYLRGKGYVGGLKHYGGGLFHIDNGDKRSW